MVGRKTLKPTIQLHNFPAPFLPVASVAAPRRGTSLAHVASPTAFASWLWTWSVLKPVPLKIYWPQLFPIDKENRCWSILNDFGISEPSIWTFKGAIKQRKPFARFSLVASKCPFWWCPATRIAANILIDACAGAIRSCAALHEACEKNSHAFLSEALAQGNSLCY